jgi:hypothetical protein
MTSDQKTSDFPAVGASGAMGILPNGFFAKKLSGSQPAIPLPQPPTPPAPIRGLPDRP